MRLHCDCDAHRTGDAELIGLYCTSGVASAYRRALEFAGRVERTLTDFEVGELESFEGMFGVAWDGKGWAFVDKRP